MSDEKYTLKIDPVTRDLVLDEDGITEVVTGDDVPAQNVRLTLQAWRGEFPFVPSHGTDYDRIMGKKPSELTEDEVPEVIRDAVFQEPEVEEVQEVNYTLEGRGLDVSVSGRLSDGETINAEVKAS